MESKSIKEIVEFGYKEFSSYVVTNRFIASIEDGLIPVYRRVMTGAYETCKDKFVKTAELSGYVLGHYHPHSQTAVEDVITELVHANILIGDGAFGGKSLIGEDSKAAASRYTRVKLNPVYSSLFDNFLPYVPKVIGELDHLEPKYLPIPLPVLCTRSSFSMAPGIMCRLPGFTYKSMYEAFSSNDYRKLESAFGYIIVNEDEIHKIFNYGKGYITYSLKAEMTKVGDNIGILVSGNPEFVRINLNKLSKFKAEGKIFVNDISSEGVDKVFIGINKGVRSINISHLYTEVQKACLKNHVIVSYAVKDNRAYPIGLRDWIRYTVNNFSDIVSLCKTDKINKLKDKISLYSNFNKVRDFIIANMNKDLSTKFISESTGVDQWIVDEIDKFSVRRLRVIDPNKEIESINKLIHGISKVNPLNIINNFINNSDAAIDKLSISGNQLNLIKNTQVELEDENKLIEEAEL